MPIIAIYAPYGVTFAEQWEMWEDAASNYPSTRYALGDIPPRYPVPAIQIEYEFGWDLTDNCCCLIHITKGRYDDGN